MESKWSLMSISHLQTLHVFQLLFHSILILLKQFDDLNETQLSLVTEVYCVCFTCLSLSLISSYLIPFRGEWGHLLRIFPLRGAFISTTQKPVSIRVRSMSMCLSSLSVRWWSVHIIISPGLMDRDWTFWFLSGPSLLGHKSALQLVPVHLLSVSVSLHYPWNYT